MGELLQALEISFGVQRKRSNEIIIRTKVSFPTYKMRFRFSFFGPLLLSNFIIFLFLIQFK
jgi:hypothetical protein